MTTRMASSNLLTRRKHDGERLMHDDCRSQHASKITVESRNNIPAIIRTRPEVRLPLSLHPVHVAPTLLPQPHSR
jgi:hypothetical protein